MPNGPDLPFKLHDTDPLKIDKYTNHDFQSRIGA